MVGSILTLIVGGLVVSSRVSGREVEAEDEEMWKRRNSWPIAR